MVVDEVAEPFDVAGDGVGPTDVEQVRGVVRDDVGGFDTASRPEEVLDRRHQIAGFGVPPAGGSVERGAALRRRPFQLGLQQIAEQVVESEPRAGALE